MGTGKTLSGKVAVITGGSRGIGAAIAKRFAAEGANVAIIARTATPGGKLKGSLSETAEAIKAQGRECLPIQADLADPQSRAGVIDKAAAHFGRVDILVNNAAWLQFKHISEAPAKHLHLGFQINVAAPHDLSREALPYMKAQGAGWIVNISSATATSPSAAPYDFDDRYTAFNHSGGTTIYGATKAGLNRLTTGWAAEMAGSNIAVNALAPVGAVASEGALAVGGWEKGDQMEPQETMAEAALQLSHRPAATLSGRTAYSLPLLQELKTATKSLDGLQILEDFDFLPKFENAPFSKGDYSMIFELDKSPASIGDNRFASQLGDDFFETYSVYIS